LNIKEKIKAASFDYANIIVDGIFDLEQIARENETKDALNAIDKEYNYKLEQAKGNATIEAALEKERAIKLRKYSVKLLNKTNKQKIAQSNSLRSVGDNSGICHTRSDWWSNSSNRGCCNDRFSNR
jgi:hypothetical protein